MSELSRPVVARRAVFLVGGYERNDAEGFFRRIGRELERFCVCWSVDARMDVPVHADDHSSATATVHYTGPDGACDADITFLSFDDIVRRDGARAFPVRLWAYLLAFFDYVVSGTMFRFFQTNWRFALYFLYPFVALLGFLWLGHIAFRIVSLLGLPGGAILPAAAGAAVAYAAGRYLGKRYFVFHLMDLWSFSREHLHCRRTDMDGRIQSWVAMIDGRLSEGRHDEVLLIGHSTGGALILDVASLLADRLEKKGEPVNFTLLTVGSTSLKVALHPAAARARERLAGLAKCSEIRWTEFQALTDIINFYKCDPYRLAGLTHQRRDVFPQQFQVRFREMLKPDVYKRIKRNFFRVHYQFISANSRRYFYDFFMICCGTRRLEEARPGSLPLAGVDPEKVKGTP
ncbi:lipase [Rhizobium sp. G187]|uniref:lipase n=1 Tax=Rhizobium sp. G187 TaxID=3451352 RepID=UPI003EE6474A